MMKIKITGPQGCGKSKIVASIKASLEAEGYNVVVDDQREQRPLYTPEAAVTLYIGVKS